MLRDTQRNNTGQLRENWLTPANPYPCLRGDYQYVFKPAVDYARTREAFGPNIGRFRWVPTRVINPADELAAARWTTYEALFKVNAYLGGPPCRRKRLANLACSQLKPSFHSSFFLPNYNPSFPNQPTPATWLA